MQCKCKWASSNTNDLSFLIRIKVRCLLCVHCFCEYKHIRLCICKYVKHSLRWFVSIILHLIGKHNAINDQVFVFTKLSKLTSLDDFINKRACNDKNKTSQTFCWVQKKIYCFSEHNILPRSWNEPSFYSEDLDVEQNFQLRWRKTKDHNDV